MSCLPCLRPYFLEKYFNFAFFFLRKDKKKNNNNNWHAFYWEYVYYNHYYNKECLAHYCGKRKQRVWTFPLLVYVLHYLFLLCKNDHTGVDAGPALLSLVRVSAGWCSFLSPASQTGCKPKFRRRGLHFRCTSVLYSGKKGWVRSLKLIFYTRCGIMLRAGERHTDRMAWVHFDLWSSSSFWGLMGVRLVWSLPAAPNSPPFRVSLCLLSDLHVW